MSKKRFYQLARRFLFLSIVLLISLMANLPQGYTKAQSNSSATVAQTNPLGRILRFLGIEKRRQAPSGRRKGGATQSLCPSTAEKLVALIPSTNIGLTLAGHPQFWFYIPPSSRRSFLAEFP